MRCNIRHTQMELDIYDVSGKRGGCVWMTLICIMASIQLGATLSHVHIRTVNQSH